MKTEIESSTLNFSEYTAQILSDPSYYGSDCTHAVADRIVARLATLIESEFPDIEVRVWTDTIGGTASTIGPDRDICEKIDLWISENWTAAL